MTTCEHPDCEERVWPGSMECEDEPSHRQSKAAPVPPEMAVREALVFLRMRIHDKGERTEPDLLAYMGAHADGLEAALDVLCQYHELRAALATVAKLAAE